jgi:hypothetical protein
MVPFPFWLWVPLRFELNGRFQVWEQSLFEGLPDLIGPFVVPALRGGICDADGLSSLAALHSVLDEGLFEEAEFVR